MNPDTAELEDDITSKENIAIIMSHLQDRKMHTNNTEDKSVINNSLGSRNKIDGCNEMPVHKKVRNEHKAGEWLHMEPKKTLR